MNPPKTKGIVTFYSQDNTRNMEKKKGNATKTKNEINAGATNAYPISVSFFLYICNTPPPYCYKKRAVCRNTSSPLSLRLMPLFIVLNCFVRCFCCRFHSIFCRHGIIKCIHCIFLYCTGHIRICCHM